MKNKNIWQKIFSSSTTKKEKNKLFLSKERDWLISTDDKKPEFIPEDQLNNEDLFLRQKDFVVEYLGIPNQAFHSYKILNKSDSELSYSLFKIKLLYKGNKNYIYHILNEAMNKNITEDLVIKIMGDDNQVMNMITLKDTKIKDISVFNKLSKNNKKAILAKVLFIHKSTNLK